VHNASSKNGKRYNATVEENLRQQFCHPRIAAPIKGFTKSASRIYRAVLIRFVGYISSIYVLG
jgi:hypothetical protein